MQANNHLLTMARLHQAIVLDYNADSAEFCPWVAHHNLLAVGTYQLDESTQNRIGQLHLYALTSSPSNQAANRAHVEPLNHEDRSHADDSMPCKKSDFGDSYSINLVQKLDVPGIFDLKWSPEAAQCRMLGAALADGTLRTYTLGVGPAEATDSKQEVLQEAARCQACSSGMALSLDWQPGSAAAMQPGLDGGDASGVGGPASDRVAISSSSGSLSIVQVRESCLQVEAAWEAHDLEVWCVAFSRLQPQLVYSGADDSCFKAWDLRQPDAPAFSNRRAHSAGVCTVSPNPHAPHLLATGSYDESVRLWDVRVPERPLLTAQVNTGGGNWRLRWHPQDPSLLLAACMYNGFAILRALPGPATGDVLAAAATSDEGGEHQLHMVSQASLEDSEVSRSGAQVLDSCWLPSSLHVEERYEAHASIAYGADWYQGSRACLGLHSSVFSVAATPGDLGDSGHATSAVEQESLGAHDLQQSLNVQGQLPSSDAHSSKGNALVATCSFYDRLLHLWSPACC